MSRHRLLDVCRSSSIYKSLNVIASHHAQVLSSVIQQKVDHVHAEPQHTWLQACAGLCWRQWHANIIRSLNLM
jgi:hypothetical protein